LIVDDQPAFAHGLRALLVAEAPKDNQVIELAHSGAEAIAIRALDATGFAPYGKVLEIAEPDPVHSA